MIYPIKAYHFLGAPTKTYKPSLSHEAKGQKAE